MGELDSVECHHSARSDPADRRSQWEGPCEPPKLLSEGSRAGLCVPCQQHTPTAPMGTGAVPGAEARATWAPRGPCSALSQAPLAALATPLVPDVPQGSLETQGLPGRGGNKCQWGCGCFLSVFALPRVCSEAQRNYAGYRRRKKKLRKKKKKKLRKKKILHFLPTLEKYAQVMSLFGISQCWEPGKAACALSMPPVLMKCPSGLCAAAAPGYARQAGLLLNTLHLQSHGHGAVPPLEQPAALHFH